MQATTVCLCGEGDMLRMPRTPAIRCHAENAATHINVLLMCSQKSMRWSFSWWTEASCSHGPLPYRLALSAGLTSAPWSSRTSPSSRATGVLRIWYPFVRLALSAGSLGAALYRVHPDRATSGTVLCHPDLALTAGLTLTPWSFRTYPSSRAIGVLKIWHSSFQTSLECRQLRLWGWLCIESILLPLALSSAIQIWPCQQGWLQLPDLPKDFF